MHTEELKKTKHAERLSSKLGSTASARFTYDGVDEDECAEGAHCDEYILSFDFPASGHKGKDDSGSISKCSQVDVYFFYSAEENEHRLLKSVRLCYAAICDTGYDDSEEFTSGTFDKESFAEVWQRYFEADSDNRSGHKELLDHLLDLIYSEFLDALYG